MHRNVTIRQFNVHFDPRLPDQESLLIQLCEHLFRSGFVFHDSTETELEAGNSVIRDFFAQEAEILCELVPRNRFNSFNDYLNNFGWSAEMLQKKLCLRILKAFGQLAKGKHHHFNIRYNIAQALRKPEKHALYDLLLYIETYHSLILAKQQTVSEDVAEEPDFSTTKYKLEDLMQLRSQLQERLEGRELVKGFMKHIAKTRGVSPESLLPREKTQELQSTPIIFIRPSKQSSSAVKAPAVILPDINQNPEKIVEDDEPEITYVTDEQGQQNEFILEPVFEQFAEASSAEIAEENIAEEVPEDNLRELNSSVIPSAEDDKETDDEAEETDDEAEETEDEGDKETEDEAEETEDEGDKETDDEGDKETDDEGDKETEDEGDKETEEISASAIFDDNSTVQAPQASLSSADLLNDLDDAADEEFIEDDEDGLLQDDTEDDDVVFGSKRITNASLEKFVRQYADSTLKFLLRRTLDGRPLPGEIEEVYAGWEKRGLSRKRLKNYVLKLMEWSEIPDMPILDLLKTLRDRVYEVSNKNKS